MEHNIEKHIAEKIQRGDIAMKSRAYFVLRLALFLAAVILLFLFIVYLISFIVFSLRASGAWFLPGFGFVGFKLLFGSLPWLLIFLAAGLIVLLELFAEHFSFVNCRPVVISLLGIIAAVFLASFLVSVSGLHPVLFRSAKENRLPVIGGFYQGYGAPRLEAIYHGVVDAINEDGFIMETPNDELLTVMVDVKDINFLKNIQQEDIVLVMGERIENRVKASAIRVIKEDTNIFRPRRLKNQPLMN